MYKKRTISQLILTLFLISFSTQAQKLKGFGTVGAYLNRSAFVNSSFLNLGAGLEYHLNPWVSPELETSFFFGYMPERTTHDNITGVLATAYNRMFWATNICLSPKITIDISNDFDRITVFEIMPRFNFSRVVAVGKYEMLNDKKTDYLSETENTVDYRKSIGVAIGIYTEVSNDSFNALSFNLYYHNIDFGNALSNLKYAGTRFNTNQVIGAGINFYFGFVKRKAK